MAITATIRHPLRSSAPPVEARTDAGLLAAAVLPPWPYPSALSSRTALLGGYDLYEQAMANVIPESGFRSRIALRDAVLVLVEYGVIYRGKFFALARQRGARRQSWRASSASLRRTDPTHPSECRRLHQPAMAGRPLQLHGRQFQHPPNSDSLYNLASSGGWTLGEAENGGDYFNAFPVIPLNAAQENLLIRLAKNITIGRCDNSTFFQDCNHGSALYGLLQLGAAQGRIHPVSTAAIAELRAGPTWVWSCGAIGELFSGAPG